MLEMTVFNKIAIEYVMLFSKVYVIQVYTLNNLEIACNDGIRFRAALIGCRRFSFIVKFI